MNKTNATPASYAGSWRRSWRVALIWMLCASVLASCAHGTARPSAPIPAELLQLLVPLRSPDAALMTPCRTPLPAFNDQLPTLLRHHDMTSADDLDCRERHRGLVDQVREREQLEAERIDRARAVLEGGPL